MNQDVKAIAIYLSLILLLAAITLSITHGLSALSLLVLAPIGAVIGPYMALTFPFSTTFKIAYVTALIASIIAIIAGLKFKHTKVGKLSAILGFAAWFTAGLIGLGTGT
jgi:ABC-type iron transport system FetAB permease component